MSQVCTTVKGCIASGVIAGRALLPGPPYRANPRQWGPRVAGHVSHPAAKSRRSVSVRAGNRADRTILVPAHATGSALERLIKDHHGAQCGCCAPDTVMSAARRPADDPTPTQAEIREHLEGNFCRCTGYHHIDKAVIAGSGQDIGVIAAE